LVAGDAGKLHRKSNNEAHLAVLNELEREGVIDRYAIGGAMGATFYVEPLLTFDLDVFVIMRQSAAACFRSPALWTACVLRVTPEEGECVLMRVCRSVSSRLQRFAGRGAEGSAENLYEEVSSRVVRAETSFRICLQTGRDKGRERVRIFREQAELDMGYLARCSSATVWNENGSNDTGNQKSPGFSAAKEARRHKLGGAAFPGKGSSCEFVSRRWPLRCSAPR